MSYFAKTFYTDISALYERDSGKLTPLFYEKLEKASTERRERIERVRDNERKAELLMSELLRDLALLKVFGIEKPELALGEDGKPYLVGAENKYFNVTHSEGLVACTVSDTECGVDIECTAHPHDLMKVAGRFFSVAEQSAVMMSPDPNAAFCRLWTIRESYVKMRGCGFSIGLTSLKCDFHRGKATMLQSGIAQTDAFFCEIKEIYGYRGAVCTKGEALCELERVDVFANIS